MVDLLLKIIVLFAGTAFAYWLITIVPTPPMTPIFRTVLIVALVVLALIALVLLMRPLVP